MSKYHAWNAPAGRCKALEELDMTKPAVEFTEEQIAEIKRQIAERIKPYQNRRCMNGRGCPMCWGR